MVQFIKDRLASRGSGGFTLDPRLGLMLMAAVAAIVAVSVVVYLWRDQGSFRPLYGAGEAYPAAEVMRVLDAEAIGYNLHPQSGQILVREDQLARARMLLTAKGIQVAMPSGYELFDKEEPLGSSQFVQDVRLKRSLEGELARSIITMKGVDMARVHLALQESTSFVVSKRDPAKASVMLQLAPGYKLKPEQVSAIVNLVASSVPQLASGDVSVVDQQGVLLSRGLNENAGPSQSWELVDGYQAKAVSNVEEVLAPILGAGNYRISVAADIDFSQREETLQSYGDNPRLRSEILRDESVLDQLALGVPGSLSNRPVPPPQDIPPANADAAEPAEGEATAESSVDNKAATSLRKESNRQLEYDQSVTHIKHAPFALRRQTVAVVLNASSAPEGGWTAEARAELESMVKSAVGFDERRGDLLTLSVFPFTKPVEIVENTPWWESTRVYELAKMGLFGLVSLLLLFMVVRPAVRNLIRSNQQLMPPMVEPPLALRTEQHPLRGFGGDGAPNILGEFNPLAEIRLPAPGSGLEMQIEHLQMLAKNDPERVSEVIKQWIGRNERTLNPAG
ncbi:flagellar M-ring protein FliF [Cellvibrio mixtus]|uniref:Flagellar M-ring protein n=1 Tax=Cellvibrio mixtus TaxID=39650 RepID=A0A266Q7Q4_9GAMM|nr:MULTISPECIES: flagellar basal-body MS-ring/collar protein FliF [Cellvibrio]AQT59874.1 flagellar M-ring protein FliF [Cellvibrio sp. PSBB023]OZY85875.1 flagellar M-ring protein FliF [Cellvibrio mixtus]